ncbi:proline iminopeptidase-family hydrolase [Streptomyces tubbatahanensis]|uniref:Proline iminopeptidase n=1 Tax=Streptomyces tubbatahanensis TaxID=2923272 RepID=A0ABY3Y0M7_9ACTN|nr:proline iminopeptidase-family hydrolase [Streptomyces tubbatahanensis]UNT00298.1 proline iminopeptidase-family hydrolase [Streptomyces tubbatahanensis]
MAVVRSVKVREGTIAVPGGEVWYRRMGRGGVPLLLVHGGPGYPSDVLFEAFEPLAAEREVVWYDQLGVGRSGPIEPSLLTVDRFLDELAAVIAGLALERPHVYGHSWGAMLGLQFAAERRPDWSSLVCANGPASVPRFEKEVRELMGRLPGNVLDRTYGRELRGETDDPDYGAAQEEYMRACVVRTAPVELDPQLMSLTTFRTMIGHADYHVTGTLKDWDIFDRLGHIQVPTLVLGGEFDECIPTHLADIAARIPGAEHVTHAGAAHMGFLEKEPLRLEYVEIIRDHLARIEA